MIEKYNIYEKFINYQITIYIERKNKRKYLRNNYRKRIKDVLTNHMKSVSPMIKEQVICTTNQDSLEKDNFKN